MLSFDSWLLVCIYLSLILRWIDRNGTNANWVRVLVSVLNGIVESCVLSLVIKTRIWMKRLLLISFMPLVLRVPHWLFLSKPGPNPIVIPSSHHQDILYLLLRKYELVRMLLLVMILSRGGLMGLSVTNHRGLGMSWSKLAASLWAWLVDADTLPLALDIKVYVVQLFLIWPCYGL